MGGFLTRSNRNVDLSAGFYDSAVGEAVNLASGKEIKIIDLSNLINNLTGNTHGVEFLEKRKWIRKKITCINRQGIVILI